MSDQTLNFEPSDPHEQPAAPAEPANNLPAKATPTRVPVLVGERGIQIKSLAELMRFADMLVISGMAPESYKGNAAAVAVAVQKGMEHGLTPMAALQAVYVVNGMPSWQGKAALGLVRASGLMVPMTYRAWIEGEGDSMVAYCESQRVGERLTRNSFSVKEAITAGLWKKDVWNKYPKRLLQWKPISHHLTDNYSDVLGNMPVAEDMLGITREVDRNAPRESFMASVQGTATEDKLLAAGGVPKMAVIIDEAKEAPIPIEFTDKIVLGVADKVIAMGAPTGDPPADENRFANLLASMDDSEDFADLERRTFRALTAAGENKAWQAQVKASSKKLLKKFPPPSDNTRG